MDSFKLQKRYTYKQIKGITEEKQMDLEEMGQHYPGRGFLLATHQSIDLSYGFILCAPFGGSITYTCISEQVQDSLNI